MRSAVVGALVRPDLLHVASGWSLLVTDPLGRLTGGRTCGFYVDNTRMLARECITVGDREIAPFACARVGSAALVSHVELGRGEVLPPRAVYLSVERFVGRGLRTVLRFDSFSDERTRLPFCVELDTDFADIDEVVKGERQQTAPVTQSWDGSELRLTYEHARLDRAVAVAVAPGGPEVTWSAGALRGTVDLAARASVVLSYGVEPIVDGRRGGAPPASFAVPDGQVGQTRERIRAGATQLVSTNLDVAQAWRTAVDDLAALPLGEEQGPAAPIAGLPLYQQVFGRDMLTAAWQAGLATELPLRDSLLLNAARIGRRLDDWHDEEPGKMLHQARRGPLAVLGTDPLAAYYGDWATVPDFLVFLGQYLAWTGDLATVRELLPAARQALGWLEDYADPDRDGFLEYDTRSTGGVKNQGWKDSDDALIDSDGVPVPNPIAASELQAYAYAALRHAAVVLAACGDRAYAAQLWGRSRRLQRRFDEAFWMPEQGSYAMALGPDKQQVRSISSNDAHLLVSGIVPRDKAPAVAARLMAPDMFSGWGIRTLSAQHPVFDPFSYHRGSVWPVEQGTAALGFARYGRWEDLHRLAEGVFAAAACFADHRLPETVAGLPRDDAHPFPSFYPRSCSPQAWSASAVVAVVHALLALRPVAAARTILVDPHLPPWLPDLTLTGLRVGSTTATIDVRLRPDGRTTLDVRDATGPLRVVHAPTRHAAPGPRRRLAAATRSSLTRGVRSAD